ncbi:S1C family serine protease [Pseudonocardia endophytica]|uniref:Putative serine protease PepD n=1 Tax=Pseudonocardia endophytica TaxID=401976 RepID=A0A4R1HF79_PSEEN|nr:trypsin-like peptidase domain-containing protein [Pseudonocardia endophytica]TCK20787.1 putative serine protease PepD [Pseudonocardia endophytica]
MVPALVLALACLVGGATAGAVAGHASAGAPTPAAAQSDPIAAAADAVTPSTVQIVGADGSSGSGVVLSPDGAILTNAHVVEGAPDRLLAVVSDGAVVPLRLVGTAPRTDLAVVRATDAQGLRPAQLGSSGALRRGESVIAVGEPLGLSGSVTRGVVSALGRPVPAGREDEIVDMIQTDAALNPGNSGGPLVDPQGRVVGITSGSLTGDGKDAAESLGFAIPIDHARRIADELLATGHATLATLPITVTDGDTGARVTGGGAGLQPGDTVTRFGNRVIGTADDLRAAVQSSMPGSSAELTVVGADGTSRPVAVQLAGTPA